MEYIKHASPSVKILYHILYITVNKPSCSYKHKNYTMHFRYIKEQFTQYARKVFQFLYKTKQESFFKHKETQMHRVKKKEERKEKKSFTIMRTQRNAKRGSSSSKSKTQSFSSTFHNLKGFIFLSCPCNPRLSHKPEEIRHFKINVLVPILHRNLFRLDLEKSFYSQYLGDNMKDFKNTFVPRVLYQRKVIDSRANIL